MTTPNGDVPSGSLGTGQFAEWQAMTEEDAKAPMRAPLSSFQQAQDNEHEKWGGFLGIANFLTGLTNAFTGSSSGGGFFSGIFNHSQAQQAAQVNLENKVESLVSGGTRNTYMLSGTFPDPGPGKTVCVAVLRGGQGGGRDSSTQNPGGIGSPYVYQEFASEELTYPVTVTVGSGGAGKTTGTGTGSVGLTSSFGTYLVVTPSTSQGGIISAQGIVASAGDAGNGGLAELSDLTPGSSGTGNALCPGGTYGSSTVPGQPGASCPTDGLAVAGGGGGAGSAWAVSGANGGAGGWPGGGGGSGVNAGGAGASGAVFVTVKG